MLVWLLRLNCLDYNRRSYPHSLVTLWIVTTAAVTGYAYARLSKDEFNRRKAYIRYTNFMILFDRF